MAETNHDAAAYELEAHERKTGVQKPVDIERGVVQGEAGSVEGTPDVRRLDTRAAPVGFPALQATTTATSTGRPYSSFSSTEKAFIVTLSSLAGVFSPIATNIYVPAIPTLAQAFSVSEEKINLTVTVYLIFQAITPAFWGAAADSYGRRPVYIVILLIYCLACMGTALCPTSAYGLLLVMRMLQATGGAAVIAIGTGVIADIALPQERGKYLGVFNLGNTFGPAMGPVLGGIFAFTLGWRSIFWFLVISSGVVIAPMLFFFPETLRSLVGDGSLPPPLLNCTPKTFLARRRETRQAKERGDAASIDRSHRSPFKPLASFLLVLEPDLLLLFLWSSLYYALWYAMLTVFSTLLRDKYHTSEIIIGLCYIPNGVGCGLSSFITGRIMDRIYQAEKRRVGGDHRAKPEEFNLERVRFIILPFQVVLLVVSIVALGWSLEARAHIAVPIVLNFLVGIGTGFLTTATIYGIDLFTGQGGAVTATFNLIRCILGAVSVSVVQIIVNAINAGWTFVLLTGVCILGTPMLWAVWRYGRQWRLARLHKVKKATERRAMREAGGGGH